MGIEYDLIKISTGATYSLGKAASRPPEEEWEKLIEGSNPLERYSSIWELAHPSDKAMWKIGTDGKNCEITNLNQRWTVRELAKVLNIALFTKDDMEHSTKIAKDILEWAGDDDVLFLPDSMTTEDVSDRLGVKIELPWIERSVYEYKT